MPRLEDRTAVVTGAGRGIGRATALRLAADGAAVAVGDLDEDVAQETAQLVRSAGGRAVATGGDVARPGPARALVEACVQEFGRVDVLVNNAGTTRDRMFHRMSEESLDVVLDANLRTAFQMAQVVVPLMREAAKAEIAAAGTPAYHRKIVGTSSVVAATGNPGQYAYTAAKGAVVSTTRTLARELGPFWINVNAVAPGFIETRLTRARDERPADERDADLGIPEENRQRSLPLIALGRFGRPEDVAAVTAFLAGPDSDYVTGVTVPVTGGQLGGMG